MAESKAAAAMRQRRAVAAADAKKLLAKKPTKKKAPHGGPRPNSGRPKGRKNSATLSLHAAYHRAFHERMSEQERAQLTPMDIFQIMTAAAIEASAWDEAAASADKWAPFVNQKLAPKTIAPPPIAPPEYDGSPIVVEEIIITGGTPKKRAFETALGRGEEDDVD